MNMEINNNDTNFKSSQISRRKDRKCAQQNGTCSRRQNVQAAYILPTVAAVLCYLNGLNGDFVHDDKYAVESNPDVTGKTPISQLFLNDFWGKPMWDNASHKSYRPFCILTFRLDYQLGGGGPWQFHVVNVALHGVVTCLFVHVLRRVVHVPDLVAGASALLFAVHPVHTEAVSGIVGRADILSGLGILLTLLFYTRSLGVDSNAGQRASQAWRSSWFWLSMATGFAAMLCKEHGLTGLGICILLDVFYFSRTITQRWLSQSTNKWDSGCRALTQRVSIVICVTAVLLACRLWVMGGQMPSFRDEDNPASFSDSFLTRVLTFNYLIVLNVWLLLCPRVLSYDWQLGSVPLVESLGDVRNLATVTVYAILAVAAWRCLRELFNQADSDVDIGDYNNNNSNKQETSDTSNVLLVSMVMMALPFLPSSNLFFRVGFVVAERVLYVPSLGFCLLVGYGAVTLWQRCCHRKHNFGRLAVVVTYITVIILLSSKTWTRNYVWASRQSLFRSGLKTFPNNAKMHYNYANFLKDIGNHKQAAEHYREAISLYSTQPSYHNNLGNVLTDPHAAEACFREALRLHPSHRGALVNLGNLLLQRNDSKGEQLLEEALAIDPHYVDALISLGHLALRRGRWERAETYLRAAIRQRSDVPEIYNLFGVLFHNTGHYEEAVASYKQAVSLDQRYTPAMTNAAASLRQLGRNSEAEDFLKRAVAADRNSEAMEQLGQLYLHAGRTRDAAVIYTQMAQRTPNDTVVMLNYVKVLIDGGEVRQAETVLTELMARAPRNPDVIFAMSHVQQRLGDTQEAMALLRQVGRLAADDMTMMAKVHYELGNLYKDLRQFSQALQSYQSSLAADPSMTSSHHNLGALHHLMGDFDKARQHYEHVLRVEPDNETVLSNLQKLERARRKEQTKN